MIDHRIAMMGQQPNILGQLAQGTQAAGQTAALQRQAQFQNMLREQGPGIMRGDQNALAAMAQYDPQAALGVQQSRQSLTIGEAQLAQIRQSTKIAAQQQAANMNAAEAARESQLIQQGLMQVIPYVEKAKQTGDVTELNQAMQTLGLPPVRDVNEALVQIAQYEGVYEVLSRVQEQNRGPEPRAPGNDYERYAERERMAGRQPVDEFTYRARIAETRGPLVQNIIGGEGSASGSPGGVIEPLQDVPAGSGRLSFGLTGALGNTANAISDFATGQDVFRDIGQNTRFFRNLEEEMLVPLAQAYPRQPAAALLERLRSLLPNVGTMEGANAALRELELMENRFARDLQAAQRRASRSPGTATQQAELERQIVGLQSLVNQVNEAKRRLTPANEQDGAVISPEMQERLNRYE